MSWDNVTGIKNIKIWTDFSDSTQGHLFVNDQHQLSLNIGLSFNLKSGATEGPTKDEVKSALSLINNQDSGPLKYLALADSAGRFNAIYDPYYPQAVPTADTDPVEDGIYDFQFTYIVTSPYSINAECYSEEVALKLEYSVTDSTGSTSQKIIETSRSGTGSSIKTYVSVACYSAKLYGGPGANRTNLRCSNTEVETKGKSSNDNYDHTDSSFHIVSLYIDDPYFKIFYLENGQEPDPDRQVEPFFINKSKDSVMWDYIYNSFFPNIKCGKMDYTVQAIVRDVNDQSDHIYFAHVDVQQQENQVTFIEISTDVKSLDHFSGSDERIHLSVFDQFGNSAYVIAYHSSDLNFIKSVS